VILSRRCIAATVQSQDGAQPDFSLQRRKPVCYIRCGDIAFDAMPRQLGAEKPELRKNLFKTKAKGVKQ
jgi:hypothetical protein